MPIREQDAYEIGVEAYTYLYPLVLMDTTRRQAVNVESGKTIGRGPMNVFEHVPIFPPADYRDVVRPRQPVEPGHHQHVAGVDLVESLAELGSVGLCAARGLTEHLFASSPGELAQLRVDALTVG
jgi:hypothetical protein